MKLLPAGLVAALLLSLPVRRGPKAPARRKARRPPIRRAFPARVELHPFPSRTLPDSAFLKGEETGQPVTLAAELRLSQASGKQPVVVLMHGSGGVGANIEPWVEQFNAMGMATLVIDGFTAAASPRSVPTRPSSGGSTSFSTSTGRWTSSRSTRASIPAASP